jgi:predicted GNAT family acetyltransferase
MTAMPTDTAPLHITHNEAETQFETTVDGLLCVAAYRRSPGMVDFHHTGVPRALEGRGIAAALVREALAWAAAEGLAVRPTCSYVRVFIRRHPELAVRQAG